MPTFVDMPPFGGNDEDRSGAHVGEGRHESCALYDSLESDSETYDMSLVNIVTGATHFELAKTDVGGPIYSHLGHKFKNDALKKP